MGGLLGIVIAAQPKTPAPPPGHQRRRAANRAAALARIGSYFGQDPTFATYPEIEAYIREISAPFGALTDAQWEFMTRTNVRQRANGRWGVAYDPGIAVPFRKSPAPPDLWPVWDAITCPTLVLRGAQSDLLSREVADQMAARGPKPRVIEFAGVGHAPDAARSRPVPARRRIPARHRLIGSPGPESFDGTLSA